MRWLMLLGVWACANDKPTPCATGTARVASGACVPVASDTPTPPEPDSAVPEDSGAPPEPEVSSTPLPAPRLLRRISLDLRGVLPSVAELDAVAADPDALSTVVDTYLEDPRLSSRLMAILGETWHTQVDAFLLEYLEYPNLRTDPQSEFPFESAAGQEPLRLMAYIGTQDRPWTDILTADFTMANGLMASIWPIALEDGGEDWQVARYTDGRPPAGVLSTNGMWLRYYSAGTNRNRGRAAAISRLLICEDFLARPVSFSDFPSLADADGTETAIKEDPYCMGCHSALDPMAASLFGFWAKDIHNGIETGWYHPERELLGAVELGVEAHWFGTPVSGLAEMAQQIAWDPRFRTCAAKTMARGLWRRDPGLSDFQTLMSLRAAFEAGDLRLRPLIKAVLMTDAYQAGESSAESDEHLARLLMPDQLHSVVEDLTGFSWWYGNFDQMANDTHGYRIMAGGVNGYHVTRPQSVSSVTQALVVQRLFEAGASTVVSHDLVDEAEVPHMLAGVTLDDRPGDEAFDEQVSQLHWWLMAREITDEELAALSELWWAAEALSDAPTAWVAVLSAMLRDPEFVSY